MRPSMRLLNLPPCLLLLIANACAPAAGQEPERTLDTSLAFPVAQKIEYSPSRDAEIIHRLAQKPPLGVKKMSDDPGEKFFLDYWTLDDSDQSRNLEAWTNTSYTIFTPPSPLHTEDDLPRIPLLPRALRIPMLERSIFDKRDYKCPSGTSACTNIGKPNVCCGTGSTCENIADTYLGDVGCCPQGQTCAGQLTSCAYGYTSCPNNPGGGCCIPGYGCDDAGCVLTSTAVVLVTPSASSTPLSSYIVTVTSTVVVYPSGSTRPANPTTTTDIVTSTPVQSDVRPATTTVYITVTDHTTSTLSERTTSTTSTISDFTTSTTSTLETACPSGYRSCPVSLGGGCCSSGLGCHSGVCPSTATYIPPVRPTTAETSTTTESSISFAGCPTDFYACSAVYGGGCCRTGRDCHSISCPARASTSLVTTNGITIIAPTGTGVYVNSVITGTCPSNSHTCAEIDGGGCCPNGYACGVSCTATATASYSGGAVVGKGPPVSASSSVTLVTLHRFLLIVLGLCLSIALV